MQTETTSGMNLMLDNTSFQHLASLLPQKTSRRHSREDLLDTLYVIEALLLADSITVPSYPGSTSYEEGERLTEALKGFTGSAGTPLIRQRTVALDTVGHLATSTVQEAVGDHLPSHEELQQISAQSGLPRTGKDITHRFWKKAAKRKLKDKDLVEAAQRFLTKNGADGALAYGLVQSERLREELMRRSRKGRVPEQDYWSQLLVFFRAHDNARLAKQLGSRYAPGEVRRTVLAASRSLSLDQLWRSIKPVLNEMRKEVELSPDARVSDDEEARSFPFLALVVLNRLPHHGEDRLDTLLRLREDPGVREVRSRISTLDHLVDADNHEATRKLRRECERLRIAVANDLHHSTGRTRMLPLPNGADPYSFTKYLLERVPALVPWTAARQYRRRPGTRILLQCAAVVIGQPSVEAAMRRYLERPSPALV